MISMNSMFGIENFVLSGLMQMIEYSNVVLHPTLVNNALSELENVVLSGLMQIIEYSNVVLHPTLVNNALSELEYDFDEQYSLGLRISSFQDLISSAYDQTTGFTRCLTIQLLQSLNNFSID